MGNSTKDSKTRTGPNAGRPTCHRCSHAAIASAIAEFSRFMPWKDDICLYIDENPGRAWLRKPDVPTKKATSATRLRDLPPNANLSLWLVVKNHYYSILAASGALRRFYPQLRRHDKRFVQFVIASRSRCADMPVRPVAWLFGKSDYRPKTVRKTTIEQFAKSLTASANLQGERCLWGSSIVVEHIDDDWSEKVHSWAVDEFLKHAWKNGFLDIHPIHAREVLGSVDLSQEKEPAFSSVLTRWKAIRILIDAGHLHPSRRQVSMRPVNTMPTWNDIMLMLQRLGMSDEAALKTRCRTVEIVYERYLAATILHESTGMPFYRVGRYIDGRDHSSVYNGIKRFRAYSAEVPAQEVLLNILFEAADNIGVYRSWKQHKRNETYLR